MRVRSLRGQLMLAFAAFATLVVVAAAIGVSILLRHAVWGPLDAAMEEEAETLATLHPERSSELAEAVKRIGRETELGGGKFLRIVAGDGRTVARSGDVPPAVAALRPVESRKGRSATVGHGRQARRVVWYPGPGDGWTEIGVWARPQMLFLRRADWTIGSAAAVALASLLALAWTMTTRATRELARLADELETIEAGSLDRRLAARHTAEVDRLASVLNRVLARLETAVGHLRRFTADAAHELRTPIAALRAHVEVTLARADSAAAYRDGLVDALEQSERLGRLANDLLTLSAVESAANASGAVRLDVVAREVAEFLDTVAQEQGRPFTCDAERAVTVRGAPELLKRLMLNLVDNAFRHTPSTAAVCLSVRSAAGAAAIEVSDRGDGMPERDTDAVFERFRRGHTPAPGAGLGLAICREIATRHGGDIALSSAPGAGTTVTVTLPLAAAPA